MRAGRLRDRITVTGKTETRDSHFGFTETSVTVASRIPADVEELSGRELERARQIDPRTTHAVRTRFRADFAAGQTVTHHDGHRGDRAFEIVAPPRDPASMHRELVLFCREAA